MQTNNINLDDINYNLDHDDYQDDNEIRAPDPVITETLIGYTSYTNNINLDDNDNDFDRIMKQSIEEFELAEEQRINDLIAKERNANTQKYNDIKHKLQKVQSYDKIYSITNGPTYDTIISIIELYETGVIDIYVLDEPSHTNIFALLKTIRLTKEEYSLLDDLIVK